MHSIVDSDEDIQLSNLFKVALTMLVIFLKGFVANLLPEESLFKIVAFVNKDEQGFLHCRQ
jgi:hypothetical protein